MTRIRLPKSLPFEDYSGIAVRGNRIAVVSQVSSALWTATLAPSTWDITGEGTTLAFPRNERGADHLRHDRRSALDLAGPAGGGLGQGEASAAQKVPRQGPIDSHFKIPASSEADAR